MVIWTIAAILGVIASVAASVLILLGYWAELIKQDNDESKNKED